MENRAKELIKTAELVIRFAKELTNSADPEILNETIELSRHLYEKSLELKFQTEYDATNSGDVTKKDSTDVRSILELEENDAHPQTTDQSFARIKIIAKAHESNQETEPLYTPTAKAFEEEFKDDIQEIVVGITDQSVNDRNAEAEETTIADKITEQRIDKIRPHIDINAKFQYIKELFGGDAKIYDACIDLLDAAKTNEQRTDVLTSEWADKYNWNKESEAVSSFYALLKRLRSAND